MTTIKVYPLWGQVVHIHNFIKYAKDNGFSIVSTESQQTADDGTSFATLTILQILTSGQQTVIKNLFAGTANIEFS